MHEIPADAIQAYWFTAKDHLRHGDKRPIIIGETHSVTGKIILCRNALHASRYALDALPYESGSILYKVYCWGDVIENFSPVCRLPCAKHATYNKLNEVYYWGIFNSKLGARNRHYVARRDATKILHAFIRKQVFSIIHLWEQAPLIVRNYLITGDESLQNAAHNATNRAMKQTTYTHQDVTFKVMYVAWMATNSLKNLARLTNSVRGVVWEIAKYNISNREQREITMNKHRHEFQQLVTKLFETDEVT